MIKGVNRRIVEITSTRNDYFEKAVLYIRPDKNMISDGRLELEARAYIGSIISSRREKEKEKIHPAIKLVCISAFVLAAVMLICILTVM